MPVFGPAVSEPEATSKSLTAHFLRVTMAAAGAR